jgi:glycosyltransferase involved in cell wall biosynthesis
VNLFSVVIPAYNEEHFLPHTLGAVQRAAVQLGEPVEIIVADNCSTDATADVARSHGATVVTVTTRCISTVRNQGAAAATGRYLVFVDADDQMSENLLVEVRKVMESGRYVGGGVARTQYDRQSWGIRITHGFVQFGLSFTGLSMFLFYLSADDFRTLGGFDEKLLSTEDFDFAKRLRALGRARGLRYKNLRSAWLIKSSRKFKEYGDWMFLRHPVLSIKAAMNNPEVAHELWYKPRR